MSEGIDLLMTHFKPKDEPMEVRSMRGELLGHYGVSALHHRGKMLSVRSTSVELPVLADIGDGMADPLEPVVTETMLHVIWQKWTRRIDDDDLHISGIIPVIRSLEGMFPAYAKVQVHKDVSCMCHVLTAIWPTATITAAEHEELFDNEDFRPVTVGGPDHEVRYSSTSNINSRPHTAPRV